MGVPGLFSFLNRRYPQITRPAGQKRDQQRGDHDQTDNLYIDMNHIIHSCTHALVAKDRPEVSQADMFAGMAAYLDNLLDLLEPRRVVMIAIDGVAPRAKINQQRTRRFLSAYTSDITDRTEREVRREMASEAGGHLQLPDLKRFDPNIITPGTEFMLALACRLREWAGQKVAKDMRFTQTAFVISDAAEPGEGEHKIMKFIRQLRVQPGYDPNTQHVVFGQDADLLLLTLLTHEPFIRIVREDMQAKTPSVKAAREAELAKQQQLLLQQQPLSAVQAALIKQQLEQEDALSALPDLDTLMLTQAASSDHLLMPMYEVVDVRLLRECLQWEFSELVGAPGPPGMYGSDMDNDNSSDSEPDAGSDDSNSEAVPPQAVDSAESAPLRLVATADSSKEDAAVSSGANDNVQDSNSIACTDCTAADAVGRGLITVCDATASTLPNTQAAAAAGDSKDTGQGLDAGSDSDDSLEDLLDLAVGNVKDTTAPTAAQSAETTAAGAPVAISSAPAEPQGQLIQVVQQQLAAANAGRTHDAVCGLSAQHGSPAAAQLLPPSVAAADPAPSGTCHNGDDSSSNKTGPDLQRSGDTTGGGQSASGLEATGSISGSTAASSLQNKVEPITAVLDTPATAAPSINKPATPGTRGSRPGSSSSRRSGNSRVQGSGAPKQRGKAGLNFENLLDDLVVLTFLAGNDFLPNVPSIDIYDKPCGLDLLFTAYKHLLPELGGHLSAGGVINRSRLVQLLVFVARDEEPAYKRRADYRRKRARERSSAQSAAQAEVAALFDGGGLSMGEVPAGVDVDQLMAGLAPGVADALGLSERSGQPAVDLSSMTPGQLCEELSNRTAARVKDRIMGGDPWAQDPIQMDLPRYRERYYEARFPELFQKCEGDVDKVAARVSWEYLQGMNWVLRYYTAGPAAIHWQQQGEHAAQLDVSSRLVGGVEDDSDDGSATTRSSNSADGETQEAAGEGVLDLKQQRQQAAVLEATAAEAAAESEASDNDLLMTLLTGPADLMPKQQQQQQGNLAPAGAGTGGASDASEQQHQHQQQVLPAVDRTRGKGKKKPPAAASASSPEGSSWTWCYPFHYAPLMQDLSKVKLWQKTPRHKQPVFIGSVCVSRQLSSPHCCPLSDWAPPGGPIRPLLQLMSVLPAKSVADALPENLANLIAIAENMDDVATVSADGSQQHNGSKHVKQQQQQQADGFLFTTTQKQQRQAGPAASTAFSALSCASEDLNSSDQVTSTDGFTNRHEGCLSPGSEFHAVLGFELTGDRDADLLRLAQALAATFPNDVAPLVDLTGKKWLHTGIVRLPMTDPQQLAAVLQAVLTLQHGGDTAAGGLSETELLGNSFRPATVITAAPASAAIATSASNTSGSSSSGSSSSSSSTDVWKLFTVTAVGPSTAVSSSNRGSSSGGSAATVSVPPTAAAASLGALGALLGQRGALHTLPTNTLQHLPSFKTRQQQQQQQGVATWETVLDVAGLPVPSHSCCLLTGTNPPELTVTPSVWRHTAAGFASAINYAERVLGIRSSSSTYNGGNGMNNGRGDPGRGGRGDRGNRGFRGVGWEGRGRGAAAAAPAGGGRGPGFYSRQAQQQQQQQQQPYLDPSLYYVPGDDVGYARGYGSSSSSRGSFRGRLQGRRCY